MLAKTWRGEIDRWREGGSRWIDGRVVVGKGVPRGDRIDRKSCRAGSNREGGQTT